MKLKLFALLFFAVLAGGALYSNSLVLAARPDPALHGLDVTVGKTGYDTAETVPSIVGRGLGAGLAMITVALLLLLLYAGLRWMTARGNAESVTKAKDIIEAALIGLVIVLSAWGLASWVFGRLNPKPPVGDSITAPGPIIRDDTTSLGYCGCSPNGCFEVFQDDFRLYGVDVNGDDEINLELTCTGLCYPDAYTEHFPKEHNGCNVEVELLTPTLDDDGSL